MRHTTRLVSALLMVSCGGSDDHTGVTTAGPPGSRLPQAGNPDGSCTSVTLPQQATAIDTSTPDHVVGTGTSDSCTFSALKDAVSAGGIITFDCGDGLVTIPVNETLEPPLTNAYAKPKPAPITTVIDGGNTITLDGLSARRIINWEHQGSWQVNDDVLVLQHIRLTNGKAEGKTAMAACDQQPNAECPTGFSDGQGGAVFARDGDLRIIDSTFDNNQAALLGPDTGGGAIYMTGTAHTVQIIGSTFTNNKASNAGAVGILWGASFIANSLFTGNSAVGTGANSVDASGCACAGNQVGSGGNGGAIYHDGGDALPMTLCGTQIRENSAKEFGAAVFFTADGSAGKVVIYDSLVKDNANGHPYWQWCASISTDACANSPEPVSSSFCQDTDASCSAACSGGC